MAIDYRRLDVLVVEKDPTASNLVKQLLKLLGVQHIAVAHSVGLAWTQQQNREFNIVFCGDELADGHGLDFVRKVRRDPESERPGAPIVLLSASRNRSDVEAARDAGVHGYCLKPCAPNDLDRHIQAALLGPRPFIQTDRYAGPDRRRGSVIIDHDGPKRRASDAPDENGDS